MKVKTAPEFVSKRCGPHRVAFESNVLISSRRGHVGTIGTCLGKKPPRLFKKIR